MKFWIVVGLLLLYPSVTFADEAVSQSQLLEWMKELEPLKKVHYSWPIPLKDVSDELLYEYVRLTHSISLRGESCTVNDINRAVEICKKVNSNGSKTQASIAINYSVWHRLFGNLPPTDFGPKHKAELDLLKKRMRFVQNSIASANRRHETNVKVGAILFDSERFVRRSNDKEWNAAITSKLNSAYDIVNRMFPETRIEWYGRGGIKRAASESGWAKSRYSSLEEKGVAFACSLYTVPENGNTRETFRRTAKHAEEYGCEQVTPWIALASGYRRQTTKFHEFSMDWNYDLIYSWTLGRELNHPWFAKKRLNERFAPWDKAKIAIFYPAPFYPKTPHWGQHFVAYVRGANGVTQLPELKRSEAKSLEQKGLVQPHDVSGKPKNFLGDFDQPVLVIGLAFTLFVFSRIVGGAAKLPMITSWWRRESSRDGSSVACSSSSTLSSTIESASVSSPTS